MSDTLENCNYKEINFPKGYYITDDGKLYSEKRKRFLKGEIIGSGYRRYVISDQGKKFRFFAHRLVAEYFVPKDKKEYNIVNHKDLNKLNNHYTNLEWTDIAGNTQHAADSNKFSIKRERKYYKENLPNEKWVKISNFPNYEISNYGRIKNKNNLLMRYWQRAKNDYYLVSLINENGKKNLSVHKLVYESFYGKIKEGNIIDHIDGDKTNYKLENLREISLNDNSKKAYHEQKLNSRGIAIAQYDLKGNLINTYLNANEAEEKTGINARSIRAVCRGDRKTTHNYIFKNL